MHNPLAGLCRGLSMAHCLQRAVAGSAVPPEKAPLGVAAIAVRIPEEVYTYLYCLVASFPFAMTRGTNRPGRRTPHLTCGAVRRGCAEGSDVCCTVAVKGLGMLNMVYPPRGASKQHTDTRALSCVLCTTQTYFLLCQKRTPAPKS